MILNGKVINPGEFRTRITLEQRAIEVEDGGFRKPQWTAVSEVWSRWVNAHGLESMQASLQGAEAPATVLIRYVSGLDTAWSVLNGSTRFEIISVDDIQNRHEFMELRVKRVQGG